MSFKGLFIGIDVYDSPGVSWLNFAAKDAQALYALFTDNLGGKSELLTDKEATTEKIKTALKNLSLAGNDDIVLISFSGHGTPTHELVAYDTSRQDLANTTVSLEYLIEVFSQINAKQVICILDCCFSGGMGAKVLQPASTSRSIESVESKLEKMSGKGKFVLTASAANEEAWENSQLAHGLLTHHFIEALMGAKEVRNSQGNVSVMKLIEFVTQRVIDGSKRLGQVQNPTMKGSFTGETSWSVFTHGEVFSSYFPELTQEPVTQDLSSLASYGFPEKLVSTWAGTIPTLNKLQLDAINSYDLLKGSNLVVTAPTSSGKTMVGELAALKGVLERKRAVFLLPLKALVYDKYKHFTGIYESYGIRVVRATGEYNDEVSSILRGQYDIALLTYEKFSSLTLTFPHVLKQIGTIVVDEVQMIGDEGRGANLEFLLTLIRERQSEGINPQLILLSATIGNSNGFERWLNARLMVKTDRPVPLNEGVVLENGTHRYLTPEGEEKTEPNFVTRIHLKNSSQDWVIPLAKKLVSENKQVIIFREIRGQARGCALYLAKHLGLESAEEAIQALPQNDPSTSSNALRQALEGGVAFHTSNLDAEERLVVEEHFRKKDSKIRVIAATTTLAMGVNTPAEAVIIVGLAHPATPPKPYAVAEYKNMVGRAGRLGFSDKGESHLLALDPHKAHYYWENYVKGSVEDLESRFFSQSTDIKTIIVRVLVAVQSGAYSGQSLQDIVSFITNSFGAYCLQANNPNWSLEENDVITALGKLESAGLVEKNGSGLYTVTDLGKVAGQFGVEVDSVIRIVELVRPLSPNEITDPTLLTLIQVTRELDDVFLPINKRSKYKEPAEWRDTLSRQRIPVSVLSGLNRYSRSNETAIIRAKRAVTCLFWIAGTSIEKIETTLRQFGGSWMGLSGQIRSVNNRTADLLPITTRVVEILHSGVELREREGKLLVRLNLGIPHNLVDVAAYNDGYLVRGDYLGLMSAGLTSLEKIEQASDELLLKVLGGDKDKLTSLRKATEKAKSPDGEVEKIELPRYQS